MVVTINFMVKRETIGSMAAMAMIFCTAGLWMAVIGYMVGPIAQR